ncbi:MAG: extradiol dioxygenase [Rhizobiaceae bacterium MnEN-MB40S]|nr:MAG: extradiol dioxygenase [Rhizobiaceae bacterium MnEN-MB40S]
MRAIAHVTFLVPSYEEGIAFFTEALGFELVEDTPLGGGKRWVLVRPSGGNGASLLIAEATDDAQRAAIGRQTGGRVGFFLHTDNFARDRRQMLDRGVEFLEEPRFEAYGTVAVFRDPFGNSWDLIEPAHA